MPLEAEAFSEAEIQQIRDFAVKIGIELEPVTESFDDHWHMIELRDVGAFPIVENREKIVDACGFLGQRKLSIEDPSSS